MRVILASASPRRRELLGALLDEFAIIVSDVEEELGGAPETNARMLALAKVRDVASRNPGAVVIGADTIVFLDGKSYAKPEGIEGVLQMWRELRGRQHGVVTGVAVAGPGFERAIDLTAKVTLTNLDDDAVRDYAVSGRPLDKAGGYAIQDDDIPTVERLEGCYCNVMGLPLWSLRRLLASAGTVCHSPDALRPVCASCPDRDA